jgi:hypothetical protein
MQMKIKNEVATIEFFFIDTFFEVCLLFQKDASKVEVSPDCITVITLLAPLDEKVFATVKIKQKLQILQL